MKHKARRVCSIILALALLVGMLPGMGPPARAANADIATVYDAMISWANGNSQAMENIDRSALPGQVGDLLSYALEQNSGAFSETQVKAILKITEFLSGEEAQAFLTVADKQAALKGMLPYTSQLLAGMVQDGKLDDEELSAFLFILTEMSNSTIADAEIQAMGMQFLSGFLSQVDVLIPMMKNDDGKLSETGRAIIIKLLPLMIKAADSNVDFAAVGAVLGVAKDLFVEKAEGETLTADEKAALFAAFNLVYQIMSSSDGEATEEELKAFYGVMGILPDLLVVLPKAGLTEEEKAVMNDRVMAMLPGLLTAVTAEETLAEWENAPQEVVTQYANIMTGFLALAAATGDGDLSKYSQQERVALRKLIEMAMQAYVNGVEIKPEFIAALFTVAEKLSHPVRITVTDADKAVVTGASVKLLSGNGVYFVAEDTSATGVYIVTVPDGSYGVEVQKGGVTVTDAVSVDGKEAELSITLGNVSTEVVGDVDVTVQGMNVLSEDVVGDAETVTFTANETDETAAGAAQIASKAKEQYGSDVQVGFLDMKLEKTTTGGETVSIYEVGPDTVLRITLPYDPSKQFNLGVIRSHDEAVEVFNKLSGDYTETTQYQDANFYADEVNRSIVLYSDKFSTFGITYVTDPDAVLYSITVVNGTADKATAKMGETVTVTADGGNSFANWTGNGVTFANAKSSVTTFTMPGMNVTVTANYSDDDSSSSGSSGGSYSGGGSSGGGSSGGGSTTSATSFSDVLAGSWYEAAVKWAVENKLMSGYANGKFGPTDVTSRVSIVEGLWNLAGKPAATGDSFTDVAADSAFAKAAVWAASNGIVNGYGDGRFGPEDGITREQLVVILYRYAQQKGKGFTGMWSFPLDFPDAAEVSDWASEAMHWMVMNGIVNGKGGALDPKGVATRAEAATMLYRFCQSVK